MDEYKERAFPHIESVDGCKLYLPGMALRDWFASLFMAARLVGHTGSQSEATDLEMARAAYRRADALLKAREVADDGS